MILGGNRRSKSFHFINEGSKSRLAFYIRNVDFLKKDAKNPFFILNKQKKIVYANMSFVQLTKIPKDTLKQKNIDELFDAIDHRCFNDVSSVNRQNVTLKSADEEFLEVVLQTSVICRRGRVVGYQGEVVHWDLASKGIMGMVLDHITDVISIQDRFRNVITMNKAGYDFFKIKPEDVIGKKCFEVAGNKSICELCATEKCYETKKPEQIEKYAKKRDIWLDIRSYPILNNGRIEFVIEQIRDITSVKKAELAKLESEAQYKSLFNDNNSVMLLIDPETDAITDANDAAVNFYGYSRDNLIGMNINNINILSQDEIKKEIEVAKSERRNYHIFIHRLSDGRLRDVETYSGKLLINEKYYLYAIIHDISDRKKFERELVKTRVKANESDLLKSAFLANLSHEIRTPMNGIIGFSDMLEDESLSMKQRKHYTGFIKRSAVKLLNVVNDILDIARIDSGQVDIFKERFNVNELTNSLYDFYLPDAEKKGIKLIINNSLPDDEAVIFSDRYKIYQVLNNLMSNSLKFTQIGSVEIGYKVEHYTLEFYVKDTGIGVPIYLQEVIFDRFRQAELDKHRPHGGVGLGLSISKAFVELLHGKIWVESEIGQYTIFRISLPFIPNSGNESSTYIVKKQPKANWKNKTILIAEDDETNFDYLEMLISSTNATVIRAFNGVEAVDLCRNNSNIDLVLMDIKMPVLNGLDATRQIKKLRKDLPVIAQTAYAMTSDEASTRDAGCDSYISKPIEPGKLFTLIDTVFKK
ncbi:MAG: PAS domain S-box protein [Bacteroidales bacterium]|nr:PAS domain S-box protein [Bacteroidales bacterium]